MDVRFYVFAGSHPCEVVLAAARHKRIDFEVVEVVPVLHRLYMGVCFRGGVTVPGMTVDGRRVHGSTAIMHALDGLAPEPPLFPADPPERDAVERAEAWGAGDLQDIGRRLVWSHFVRDDTSLKAWAGGAGGPVVRRVKVSFRRPMARIAATANKATEKRVREDLATLPSRLDEVDELIDNGVIGGANPNAADFQILSSVALWMMLADVRPAIEWRPCAAAASRLFPVYDREISAGTLPTAWFEPLRAGVPAMTV